MMLKIHHHIGGANPDGYLSDKAEALWTYLNPLNGDGELNFYSLKHRLARKLVEVKTEHYLVDYCAGNKDAADRHLLFFEYLAYNNYENLRRLIVSIPSELELIRGEINNILNRSDYYDDVTRSQTRFGRMLLDELFVYTSYRKSAFCSQAVTEIGLQHATCPYCNNTMIDVVDLSDQDDDNIDRRAYLDIDHHMPKSQNPFFALSFFNMIPSCHWCNSNEKGNQEFLPSSHINPFDRDFDDTYSFVLNPLYMVDRSVNEPVSLKLDQGQNDQIAGSLHLNQRYANGSYAEALKFFNFYQDNYNLSDDPVFGQTFRKFILLNVPLNKSEILKFIKGKLMRDIIIPYDHLGILNE